MQCITIIYQVRHRIVDVIKAQRVNCHIGDTNRRTKKSLEVASRLEKTDEIYIEVEAQKETEREIPVSNGFD